MTTVSVIIPAHNASRTLGETLSSIISQRVPVQEIIVIDDGSTDATAEIAAAFVGVHLTRQANAGPAAALNAGLTTASGTILGFLDADDLWTPNVVGFHLDNLAKRTDADASVGIVEEFVCPSLDKATARRFQPRQAQPGWVAGATFVRAESLRKVGNFDLEARAWPWVDWAHRAKLKGLIFATMDHVVLQRRLHPGSFSMQDGNKGGASLIGAARRALQRHRAAGKLE